MFVSEVEFCLAGVFDWNRVQGDGWDGGLSRVRDPASVKGVIGGRLGPLSLCRSKGSIHLFG